MAQTKERGTSSAIGTSFMNNLRLTQVLLKLDSKIYYCLQTS
jgi:hypothetical protein